MNVPELQERARAAEERLATSDARATELEARVTALQAEQQTTLNKFTAASTEKTHLLKRIAELEVKTKDLLEQQKILIDVSRC